MITMIISTVLLLSRLEKTDGGLSLHHVMVVTEQLFTFDRFFCLIDTVGSHEI